MRGNRQQNLKMSRVHTDLLSIYASLYLNSPWKESCWNKERERTAGINGKSEIYLQKKSILKSLKTSPADEELQQKPQRNTGDSSE